MTRRAVHPTARQSGPGPKPRVITFLRLIRDVSRYVSKTAFSRRGRGSIQHKPVEDVRTEDRRQKTEDKNTVCGVLGIPTFLPNLDTPRQNTEARELLPQVSRQIALDRTVAKDLNASVWEVLTRACIFIDYLFAGDLKRKVLISNRDLRT